MSAQIPALDWSYFIGGQGKDIIRASAVDGLANVVNVGYYEDTVDFAQGPQVALRIATLNFREMYVQKIDNRGNFLWVKTFPSPSESTAHRVVIGQDESIYISGFFSADSLDFDPDPNQNHFLQRGNFSRAAFILKLSKNGSFRWAISQSGDDMLVERMVLDSLDNIYAVGLFSSTIDKNPDPLINSFDSPLGIGKDDFFVQKLDSSGNQSWFKTIKGQDDVRAKGIAILPSNEPIIVGYFKGSVDFDPGIGSAVENPIRNEFKGFIQRLDTSGNFISINRTGGAGEARYLEVEVDAGGIIYASGLYVDYPDFDPSNNIINPPSANKEGLFLQRFNPSGVTPWVHAYENPVSGTTFDPGFYLAVDDNKIYCATTYRNTISLEPNLPNGLVLTRPNNLPTILVIQHDSSGSFDWVHDISSTQPAYPYELTSKQGMLTLTGYFWGTIGFDPYLTASARGSRGDIDAFVLQFSECPPPMDTSLYISSCKFFEISPGNKIYKDSVVVDTFSLLSGCDSIARTNIDIYNLTTVVTSNMGTLAWDSSGTGPFTYKWYDCINDSIISGQSGKIFKPTQNGSYALIVSDSFCTDTSDCLVIDDIGLVENPLERLTVFPNPVSYVLSIAGETEALYDLDLLDLAGRKIVTTKQTKTMHLESIPNGTYLLRIKQDSYEIVKKLIKQ